MKYEQEQHLNEIIKSFMYEVAVKYRKGQKEHGGNLTDMSMEDLIDNVIAEAIDLYVYAFTLRTQIREQNRTSREP